MAAAEAFADELKTLRYTAGRNLTIEYRWVVSFDRLGEEAAELAKHPLDAIVVVSTPAALAARQLPKRYR